MKEEWLMSGAVVPVDVETTAALVAEIKRLIDVVGGMALAQSEQLQLPEPRLTGKFSITAGKFKCTGCTGTWTDREDAKHHLCKDYQ